MMKRHGNTTSKVYCIKRLFLVLLVLGIAVPILYSQLSWIFMPYNVYRPCNFDNVNYFDSSLAGAFYKAEDVKCERWESFVDFDEKGVLQINRTVLETYGFDNYSHISCRYIPIERKSKKTKLNQKFLHLPAFIPSDFCFVRCYYNNETHTSVVYQNIHYKVEANMKFETRQIMKEEPGRPSIIVFVLDSVSRLVAENALPKTMQYFRDHLNAFDMKGYTKIGDNSQPNYLALVTGKFQYEVILKPSLDFPWLFREMRNRGYIDSYSDDWDPALPGFAFKLPEYAHDMSFETYFHAERNENMSQFVKDIKGKMHHENPHFLCVGNQFRPFVLIDYFQQFINKHPDAAKFMFMWQNEISHGGPNYLHLIDDKLYKFFENLKTRGKLNNTFILLMSDHGPRYGPILEYDLIRKTNVMPLLSIVVPENVKSRYPDLHQNIKQNMDKLTTPFDVFRTLSDIITTNYDYSPSSSSNIYDKYLSRGISLFDKIPSDRSCFDASIPENYCPCYTFSTVSVDNIGPREVADFLIAHINEKLNSSASDNCMKLKLVRILSAQIQHVPRDHMRWANSVRYVVRIETVPGPGIFQATADRYNATAINVIGDVNRMNAYGNQSHCVEDKILKLYCYCRT